MQSHYNSEASRLQILTMLEAVDFQRFKDRNDISSDRKELSKQVELINASTNELSAILENSESRLGHLRRATKQEPWASARPRSFLTMKHSYHLYILALQDVKLLDEEYNTEVINTNYAYQQYNKNLQNVI